MTFAGEEARHVTDPISLAGAKWVHHVRGVVGGEDDDGRGVGDRRGTAGIDSDDRATEPDELLHGVNLFACAAQPDEIHTEGIEPFSQRRSRVSVGIDCDKDHGQSHPVGRREVGNDG